MGVDVDQSGSNDLAARIDRLGGIARDVGLDRDDLAAGNGYVAYRIEPNRGVDDAPALNKKIVGRRASFWNVGEQRSPTHAHELASVHHGRQPLSLDHRRGHGEKKSRRACLVRSYLITGIDASPAAPGRVSLLPALRVDDLLLPPNRGSVSVHIASMRFVRSHRRSLR